MRIGSFDKRSREFTRINYLYLSLILKGIENDKII